MPESKHGFSGETRLKRSRMETMNSDLTLLESSAGQQFYTVQYSKLKISKNKHKQGRRITWEMLEKVVQTWVNIIALCNSPY